MRRALQQLPRIMTTPPLQAKSGRGCNADLTVKMKEVMRKKAKEGKKKLLRTTLRRRRLQRNVANDNLMKTKMKRLNPRQALLQAMKR